MAIEFAQRIRRIPVYPVAAGYRLGDDVAMLASNESCFGPLPQVVEAAQRSIATANRYPDPSYSQLRGALSQRYGIPESRIALGNGSCDILLAAGEALLEPGAEVIYSWPAFSVRRLAARVHPGHARTAPPRVRSRRVPRRGRTAIGAHLRIGDGATRAVFIGVRRFRGDLDRDYWSCVEQLVAEFPDRRFVVATLEPPEIDTINRDRAYALARRHPNVSVFDFTCNPMALLAWLRENAERLVMIAPQYHLLVSAHICGIPLYPMAYDEKVEHLLRAYDYVPVRSFYALDLDDLRTFLVEAPEAGATIGQRVNSRGRYVRLSHKRPHPGLPCHQWTNVGLFD